MNFVFIGQSGTQSIGLFLLVRSRTGVTYGHQCGETHELKQMEGYLVPFGESSDASPLRDFFRRLSPETSVLESGKLEALQEIVSRFQLVVVNQDFDSTTTQEIELDIERASETINGWIPMRTYYGSSVLIYDA